MNTDPDQSKFKDNKFQISTSTPILLRKKTFAKIEKPQFKKTCESGVLKSPSFLKPEAKRNSPKMYATHPTFD
jgi:hypothetical protein